MTNIMVSRNFIYSNMLAMPVESNILKRIVLSCGLNGAPIVKIFDGDEYYIIENNDLYEIENIVFNLDEAYLITNDGSILFILGNEWDCISDYSVSLEDVLAPVNAYIESNW